MKNLKKKAAFAICLLITLSAAVPSFSVSAEDDEQVVVIGNDGNVSKPETESSVVETDTMKYSVNEDGIITVLSFTAEGDVLTLPEDADGKAISSVSGGAFQYLNVKKVIIPASVTYDLSVNPFASGVFIEEFEVSPDNKNYASEDGVLYTKDKKKLISWPAAKAEKQFSVPEGTEEIGIAAFYGSSLEEITLPAGVKKLERHCFSNQKALEKIDLGHTKIKVIPAMTFVDSEKITDIILPETLEEIEVAAFMNCSSLEEITLPESLESVGQSAFQGTAMKQVVIPESVVTIGYNAFGYKDEDSPVSDFAVIGVENSAAHSYCTDEDTEYSYKNDFAFYTLEGYKRRLELEAMDVQTEGDLMYSVDENNEVCIVSCSSSSSVVQLPDLLDGKKVTSLYYGSLQGCLSEEIILPDGIRKIGEKVFPSYVRTVKLPGDLEEIEKIEEQFIACSELESVTMGDGNGNFCAENGVLYSKDKSVLVLYPQAKKDKKFILPDTVKKIAYSACCYNNQIEELDISSAEDIDDYAFEGCTALTSVKLARKINRVGQNAFLGCRALPCIRTYEIDTIAQYAFGYDYDAELEADINANPEKYAEAGYENVMPYSVIDGFKMYVKKGSLAQRYADDCGIETVTNSVTIGNSNVDVRLFYGLGGLFGAGLIAGIIKLVAERRKNKKKSKPSAAKK